MGIAGANNTLRLSMISSLDGTTTPSNMGFYDGMGKLTVGVGVVGSTAAGMAVYDGNSILAGAGIARITWGITGSGPLAGIGGGTFDANGKQRTGWGDAVDDSESNISFYDANGGFRTGVEYFPPTAYNGFLSQDGSGNNLSLLGSVLAPVGIFAANDSFMQLIDTTGQIRVIDLKNSTNDGGLAFSPTNVFDGGWGNP
jgi:hypothetical protein